jgi:hypothetical protein
MVSSGSRFICIALVSASLGNCVHLRPSERQTLTREQTRALAQRIIDNTPEHVHWAKGTVFSWVLLSPEINSNPPELRDEVITRLKQKYTVYLRKEELPDEVLMKDSTGGLAGYRCGFSFSFQIELESDRTVKVHYADWEGNVAGSRHWTRYEWAGFGWKVVGKSRMEIS